MRHSAVPAPTDTRAWPRPCTAAGDGARLIRRRGDGGRLQLVLPALRRRGAAGAAGCAPSAVVRCWCCWCCPHCGGGVGQQHEQLSSVDRPQPVAQFQLLRVSSSSLGSPTRLAAAAGHFPRTAATARSKPSSFLSQFHQFFQQLAADAQRRPHCWAGRTLCGRGERLGACHKRQELLAAAALSSAAQHAAVQRRTPPWRRRMASSQRRRRWTPSSSSWAWTR